MYRRQFLSETGMGFTGLVMAAMLAEGQTASHAPTGLPHFAPKAKRVIWLFMIGGVSQVESFDPKPALQRYGGKKVSDTDRAQVLTSPLVKATLPEAKTDNLDKTILPMQIGFKKYGQSGAEVSDWWPHVGGCVDDLAIIRSMWTTHDNHGAQLQFHTGRHPREGYFPTIGAWVHYGLGSLNENLPQFVVLGQQVDTCCGGVGAHGASYLGPEHNGLQLSIDPKTPLPFAHPAGDMQEREQKGLYDFVNRMNRITAARYPEDAALRARIKSYEMAFRMQTSVPEVFRFEQESAETRKLYGLDREVTKPFGETCLTARRLAERGVRFIQVFHGGNSGAGAWDAHSNLATSYAKLCAQVDQPIAGLLKDLKQRGLLDDTLVVWATEFGRTPADEGGTGRNHHPFGFSVWLAGGGVRGGIVHGATDELGFHAVENRHYVTDLHATVLHQLGLDPRRLEVPDRKRLEVDFGKPIQAIL